MKFFKYIPKSLTALALVLTASSCSLFDLDVNQDPNNPTVASPDLVLARIETDIASNLGNLDTSLETFIGLMGTQTFSRFELKNSSFNDLWVDMYSGPLKDVDGLIASTGNSPRYQGVGQILKAYMYATMVDLYGDIPFSEAGKADDAVSPIKTPLFDKDADVYAACIKLVDEGMANLTRTPAAAVSGDIFYGGSVANWTAFGKTLKLKLLLTSRKANPANEAAIKALITAGGFITQAQDFQFTFSKDVTSIRHPWYTGCYTGGDFDGSYLINDFMADMYCDADPRLPFYVRRMTATTLNPANKADKQTVPSGYLYANPSFWKKCFTDKGKKPTKDDSTYVAGLFGRERCDPTGVPADNSLRAIPGVYPCGGYYDVKTAAIPGADKAPGGGIFPILTSVNVLYYQIEAILMFGATGDARKLFEQAIRDHITKVVNFSVATDPASVRPTSTAIDAYVNVWLAKYDAGTDNTAKLDACMKQLWFSSYGSGMELYNVHRRLKLPTTLPEAFVPTSRKFPKRLPYAQSELTSNPNAANYLSIAFDGDAIFWAK